MSEGFEKGPQDLVQEFHEVFDPDSVATQPGWPDLEQARMRVRLMLEELDEVALEFEQVYGGLQNPADGLAAVGKELADLLYVVYGTGVTLGLPLDGLLAAVHANNMTKLWSTDEMNAAQSGDGVHRFVNAGDGKWVAYREDGKVLKPPSYEKLEFAIGAIVIEHAQQEGGADD